MPNAFQVEELDGGIGLLTLRPARQEGEHARRRACLRELAGLVGQLAERTDLRGLLLRSGKPGQFIAGADLNELAHAGLRRTGAGGRALASAIRSSADSAGCRSRPSP